MDNIFKKAIQVNYLIIHGG